MPDLPHEFLRIPLAHRGLHDRTNGVVENSLSAFRAAIDAGYGIELDLQMSSDAGVMVFHDYHLGRLTHATGPVAARTAAELQQIKLRDTTDRIPHLSDVLDLVAGRVPLLIEIKDQDGALGPNTGQIEAGLANLLHAYDGLVAIMSFNPHSIAKIRTMLPDTPRGLTTCAFLKQDWGLVPAMRRKELANIPDFFPLDCAFISHDRSDLNAPAVQTLRNSKIPILTWTIRSPSDEASAREIADNITFENYLPAIPQD